MNRLEILLDSIGKEVRHARELHSPMNSLHEGYAVILEEMDEFWEEVKMNPKKLDITARERRINNMRKELVQIAAMCVRTVLDCELKESL
jgi:hypothetical protein